MNPILSILLLVSAQGDSEIRTWKKFILTEKFYSEGADFGDFNKDGKLDVVSGPYWYEGPAFAKRNTIYKPVAFPRTSFADRTRISPGSAARSYCAMPSSITGLSS